MGSDNGLSLRLDPAALRPLVREIVEEVLAQLEDARARTAAKMCYSEAEAARLLGLNVHQLRDERLRGRIGASKIVGGRIRYQADDLERYLRRARTEATRD